MIRPVHGKSFHPDGKGLIELEVKLTQVNVEMIMLTPIQEQTTCMMWCAFAKLMQSPVPTWHALLVHRGLDFGLFA